MHALLLCDDRITIEVRGSLLELGEVLDGTQRSLRAEQTLLVHTAKARRVDAAAKLLWPDVANEVRTGVRMAVGVALEARHAHARFQTASIGGLIELLLREQ